MPENAENAVVPVAQKRPRSSGRARKGQAKRETGIPREPPWSKCNRTEKERGEDEDGEWERDVFISRQHALLKAGVSASARTAAAGAAVFGGSPTVQASEWGRPRAIGRHRFHRLHCGRDANFQYFVQQVF